MKRLAFASLYLVIAAAVATAGCPSEFAIDEVPKIEVAVDGVIMPDDGTGSSLFPPANQLQVVKEVTITNPGDAPLNISNIAWKPRDDGGFERNDYLELDLGSISFPYEMAPNSTDTISFNIIFTPPPGGGAIDDFSDSVLVVTSDAKDQLGRDNIPTLDVTFQMTQNACIPIINPPNYTFTNATTVSPETQIFSIEQDPQASGACVVTSVSLSSPSPVYQIIDAPISGTIINPPNQPDYVPATFSVRYTPTGGNNDPTNNSVLVVVDGQQLNVPLKANNTTGGYTLSYNHPNKFDFSTVSVGGECRRVIIISEGPAPLRVEQPSIDPVEASPDFDIAAYLPATAPGEPETLVESWPRALAQGRSIEIQVCYNPSGDPADSQNGKLLIPIGTPDPGEIKLDVFAGSPKSLLDIAPESNAISVSASLADSETGVRHAVLYNNGNADLIVIGATTTGKFIGTDAEVFSVTAPTNFDTPIPPGGVMVLDISYDSTMVGTGQTSASEVLEITTVNGFTGQEVTDNVLLDLNDTAGVTIPTANPGTYDGVVAGEAMFLSPSASTAGDGSFQSSSPWARWYLTAKPDGSRAELNTESANPVEFRPDLEGSYTVELVVYASASGEFYYSEPASVTFTAGPAPAP